MEKVNRVLYLILPSGDNPVKNFLDSLDKIQKAKVFRIFDTYEFFGLSSIIPHTKKLIGTPFWEIRIIGKDNIRIIYITRTLNSILILHGFTKKKQKTPKKELNVAIDRYNYWRSSVDNKS